MVSEDDNSRSGIMSRFLVQDERPSVSLTETVVKNAHFAPAGPSLTSSDPLKQRLFVCLCRRKGEASAAFVV